MKQWNSFLIAVFIGAAVLASCGDAAATGGETMGADAPAKDATPLLAPAGDDSPALSAAYRDALAVDLQLAVGIIRLDGTDFAVTTEQSATLLPLWRVLDSLKQSGSASEAEIDAVVQQISGEMSSEQIASIAAMELTRDEVQSMMEEGTLGFGRGLRQQSGDGSSASGMRPGGGPGGGLLRGPGGGFAGDGPGGDPGAMATRQAELATGDTDPVAAFLEQAATGLVVRLLEAKTGEAPVSGFGAFGEALAVISEETGVPIEQLRGDMAEGQTLIEIVEASGSDVEDVKTKVAQSLGDSSLADGQDLDSWVDELFAATFSQQTPSENQP